MSRAVKCFHNIIEVSEGEHSFIIFRIDVIIAGGKNQVIFSKHFSQELEILVEYVRQGRLQLGHVVARSVPLEEKAINDAMDALEQFGGEVRTVVVP